MSRNKTSGGASKFKRLLGWTVLMAIVFSAGLITGERLVRRKSSAPLVSVTDQVDAEPADRGDNTAKDTQHKTSFAFFDQLTRNDDKQGVALAANRDDGDHDAPEATPDKAAPESANHPDESDDAAVDAKDKTDDDPAKGKAGKTLAARYTLQVAAHPDLASARRHMKRLKKMGLEPRVISASIPNKGKFYRVRVGKFHSMDEARTFQANLKADNQLNTFVSPL